MPELDVDSFMQSRQKESTPDVDSFMASRQKQPDPDSFMAQKGEPSFFEPVLSSGRIMATSLKGGLGSVERGLGTVLEGTGLPFVSTVGRGMRQVGQERLQAVEQSPDQAPSFLEMVTDPGPKKLLDFLSGAVLSSVPQMATVAAGGLATGGTAAGPLAGAFAAGWILEAGNDYQELREQGVDHETAAKTAGFTGALKGVLEAAPIVGKVGGRLFFKAAGEAGESTLKRIGQQALAEGATEGGQEIVGMAGERATTGKPSPFNEALARVLNAAAAGAVAGPVFGQAADAVARQRERQIDAAHAAQTFDDVANPDVPTDAQLAQEGQKQPEVPAYSEQVEEILARPSESTNPAIWIQDQFKEQFPDNWRQEMNRAFTAEELAKVLKIEPEQGVEALETFMQDMVGGKLLTKTDEGTYKFRDPAKYDYNWLENVMYDPRYIAGTQVTEAELAFPGTERAWIADVVKSLPFMETVDGTTVPIVPTEQNPPEVVQVLKSSPFLQRYTSTIDGFIQKATKLLAGSEQVGQLANVFNLPYYLQGSAIWLNDNEFGIFLGAPGHGRIGMNPYAAYLQGNMQETYNEQKFGRKGVRPRPRVAAENTWDTFAHELVHSVVAGHEENFLRTETLFRELLQPIEAEFINEMEKVFYDPNQPDFSNDDIAQDYAKIREGKRSVQTPKLYHKDEEGQTPAPRGKGRRRAGRDVGTKSGNRPEAGRGAGASRVERPEVRGDVLGTQEGGAPGTRSTGEEYQRRGDFPSHKPEVAAFLEEAGRREALDSLSQRIEFNIRDDSEDENPATLRSVSQVIRIPGLAPQARMQIYNDNIKYGRFARRALMLTQILHRNKLNPAVQRYVQGARNFWATKTKVTMRWDNILTKTWPWSSKSSMKLTRLLEAITNESHDKRRRLTQQEKLQIATRLDAVDHLPKYEEHDQAFRDTFIELRDAQIERAQRVFGPGIAPTIIAAIHQDFNTMMQRNYFPYMRFGKFGVVVRAKRTGVMYDGKRRRVGEVVYFAGHDSKKFMEEDYTKQYGQLNSADFDVKHMEILDVLQEFLGFPPILFEMVVKKLNLDPAQIQLGKELVYALAPGRSFVKHLKRKRGVAGYSMDFQRAIAAYAQSASNHIARIKHEWELDEALQMLREQARSDPHGSTSYDPMFAGLFNHKQDLLNPGDSLGALRGFASAWFFVGIAAQFLVNTASIPMLVAPYLMKRHPQGLGKGDAKVAGYLMSNLHKSMRYWNDPQNAAIEPYKQRALAKAMQEGLINQGFATSIATIRAVGTFREGVLNRAQLYKAALWVNEKGMLPMSVPEENNRRVALWTAMEMAMKDMGLNEDQAYAFAKETIDNSLGNFERWNRAEWFRGRASILTLFKAFMQHTAFFAFQNMGGWRYWVMGLLTVGIAGQPLAKELEAILSMLGTSVRALFGKEDPKWNAELALREWVEQFGLNPDWVMHGLSRHFGGLTLLNQVGIPMPDLDFSGMLSFGEVMPEELTNLVVGLPLAAASKLSGKPELNPLYGQSGTDLAFKTLAHLGGPTATIGLDFVKAVDEQNTEALHWLARFLPRELKHMSKSLEMATTGALTDSRGRPVVRFDMSDPKHVMEAIGQLAGAPPAAVGQKYEERFTEWEWRQYYTSYRQYLLSAYKQAIRHDDSEALDDVINAIAKANKMFPPPFKITGESIQRSVRQGLMNESLDAAGMPAQSEFRAYHERVKRAFPTTQAPQ